MKLLLTMIISLCLYSNLNAKSNIEIVQDLLGSEFNVKKVEKSHGNMHVAYIDSGELVYVDIKNKLIFYGIVLEMKGGELVNLTRSDKDKWQEKLDKQTMNNIDMKEIKRIAVLDKVNGGNSKNVIIQFDSLTCPYCLKVNRFFEDAGYKLDVYRIYNNSGPVIKTLKDNFGVKDPDKRLEEMDSLYKKYRVLSTPNIFVVSNSKITKIIKGANMKEIQKWIKK